jgi:hypothetical protein
MRARDPRKQQGFHRNLRGLGSIPTAMTNLPPSPDIPAWAYWILVPAILALAILWRFISSNIRRSKYSRNRRRK